MVLVSILGRQAKKIYRSLYFAPIVVFFAVGIITYWSWTASIATLNRDIDSAVVERTTRIQNGLAQQLSSYEQILIGGAGLVRGSESVTQNEWHDYVSTFDLSNRYPGIQGVGYIKTFTAAELPELIASQQQKGINLQITPDPPRDFYTAILYVDPPGDAKTIGLDMFVEPQRMKSMAQARDTGQTNLTPPVKPLIHDTDAPVLFLYVAQYANNTTHTTTKDRQQALQGYVYAQILPLNFFQRVEPDQIKKNNLAFTIAGQDSSASWTTLYESQNYGHLTNTSNIVKKEQTMKIYGQTWKISYVFNVSDLLPAPRLNTPIWTVVAGIVFAILLSEIVYLLLKARANELSTLKEEAVDLAKDELLSLASHQLRTPATTVKQYLGMVLQGFAGDITPTQASLLDKAYAGNERQLYIINEMLHIAKIDAGRIVLARHNTNINHLLRDVVQEAQTDAKAANHKLKLSLPKKPIIINVDEHMLRMAIENLVSNAIKYTLTGGKISVSLQQHKDVVYVDVQDSGVGIEPKDLAKLYKLFTRLDNELTAHVGGTGVGLYLAKHLVELHNGTLTVTSKPKVGSTFTITLPLTIK